MITKECSSHLRALRAKQEKPSGTIQPFRANHLLELENWLFKIACIFILCICSKKPVAKFREYIVYYALFTKLLWPRNLAVFKLSYQLPTAHHTL